MKLLVVVLRLQYKLFSVCVPLTSLSSHVAEAEKKRKGFVCFE